MNLAIHTGTTLQSQRHSPLPICNNCPHLSFMRTCGLPVVGNYLATGEKLCGCFVDLKTKTPGEHCPLKKW